MRSVSCSWGSGPRRPSASTPNPAAARAAMSSEEPPGAASQVAGGRRRPAASLQHPSLARCGGPRRFEHVSIERQTGEVVAEGAGVVVCDGVVGRSHDLRRERVHTESLEAGGSGRQHPGPSGALLGRTLSGRRGRGDRGGHRWALRPGRSPCRRRRCGSSRARPGRTVGRRPAGRGRAAASSRPAPRGR